MLDGEGRGVRSQRGKFWGGRNELIMQSLICHWKELALMLSKMGSHYEILISRRDLI